MVIPAGIDIKASHPELALSIIAEIILILRIQANFKEENNIGYNASFGDPICGMTVISNKKDF